MRDVLVYVDEGSSFETLMRELGRELDHARARLLPVMAEDLTGSMLATVGTLVMPGGADLPYCALLNGAGNRRIREFVEAGGTYLGVCAGAYYGCRSLAFHEGWTDEISGPRELAFINAQAIGSLGELGPFYDLTIRSASVPTIDWDGVGTFRGFYHGGPRFAVEDDEVTVFARFSDVRGSPAGVQCSVGAGMAVLVAIHLEVTPASLIHSLSHLTDGASFQHFPELLESTESLRRRAFRDLLRRASMPLKAI